MKSYLKGLVTGFLISACLFAIPVLGDNIEVLFNSVRININGLDKIQWGENITLDDGSTTPSSLLYNGTTYLPLRKIGELTNKEVCYNGDTKTVTLTPIEQNVNILTKKPDENGNVWKYYTFGNSKEETYLAAEDINRGYKRVYALVGNSVRITDDAIYFIKHTDVYDMRSEVSQIVKLPFANNSDTQDGEYIHPLLCDDNLAYFDGNYVFYYTEGLPGRSPNIRAVNYITKESDGFVWQSSVPTVDIQITETSDNSATLRLFDAWGNIDEVTFDKKTNTFSKPVTIERKLR